MQMKTSIHQGMFRDFPAEHSVMTTGNLGKGTVRESGSLHGDKEVRFTQAGHVALGWLLLNTRRQSLLPTESTSQLRQVEGSAGLDGQDPPEEGGGRGRRWGYRPSVAKLLTFQASQTLRFSGCAY